MVNLTQVKYAEIKLFGTVLKGLAGKMIAKPNYDMFAAENSLVLSQLGRRKPLKWQLENPTRL